ncbi:MAG TPA: alpha/beta fold hydrolase, partial [Gemmatimonadaceae bacterium]|nr:alpha/beta fold hydrolase [Gemmatimonadaceae bacterium]
MKVRAGGIELGYDEAGSGTAILFLHGFPHDRTLWAPQLTGLSRRGRVIAPDLRGFGESTAAPPYSVDQYADDAAALLDALNIERAVVGGLSMGGYAALAFWRRHRHRVRALVLADTRAGADTDDGKAKRREMIELARTRGSSAVAQQMITGMVGKTTRDRRPETVDSVRAMMERANVDGVVGALEAMTERPDSTSTLSTIDVPALIIVGAEDVLTPPKEAATLASAIPRSTLEVIPRAGHVSNVERPAAFNYVVTDFLRRAVA